MTEADSGSHRTQEDTNHQNQSLYCTHLYLLFFLNQVMMFIKNPLIATEALHKGLKKKRKERCLRDGFHPLPAGSERGGKKER